MSNTPETEVLRISGNVMLLPGEDVETAKHNIEWFLKQNSTNWSGSIVPQDDPSGMRLYRVEDIEAKDRQISVLQRSVLDWQITNDENQKLFKKLSEELAQEREAREQEKLNHKMIDGYAQRAIDSLLKENETFKTRLKFKESRWRTFIKWWEGTMVEFKSLSEPVQVVIIICTTVGFIALLYWLYKMIND